MPRIIATVALLLTACAASTEPVRCVVPEDMPRDTSRTLDLPTACDAWSNAVMSRATELCGSPFGGPTCPFEGPVDEQMHYFCLLAMHEVSSCDALHAYGPECLVCLE